MNQIYRFDSAPPPILTKAILEERAKQKKDAITIILLTIGSILLMIALLLFSVQVKNLFPYLFVLFVGYVFISLINLIVLTIVYLKKGGLYVN